MSNYEKAQQELRNAELRYRAQTDAADSLESQILAKNKVTSFEELNDKLAKLEAQLDRIRKETKERWDAVQQHFNK